MHREKGALEIQIRQQNSVSSRRPSSKSSVLVMLKWPGREKKKEGNEEGEGEGGRGRKERKET